MDRSHGTDTEILKKLDMLIAILQLAFKDRIEAARAQVLADPVAACILEATQDGWIEAGDLKSVVAVSTKQSERTVSRRIAVLLGQRFLEQTGTGKNIRYRSTNLA